MRETALHQSHNAKEASTRINILEKEIHRLRMMISKISDNMSWNNSVVKIVFRDESFCEKYRKKVEMFFKDMLDKDERFLIHSQIDDLTEQEFKLLENSFEKERLNLSTDERTKKLSSKEPIYQKEYEDVMHCDEVVDNSKKTTKTIQDLTCFNCLGDHHMKQCPEPINWLQVAANKQVTRVNSSRYHKEEVKSSLKPGSTLSTKLRDALGLRDHQLPPYIYTMRVIGYPPGWKEEQLFETSGLSLYDGEGKSVEADESLTSETEKKLIEFPGFNCPMPSQFKDEWKKLGLVPMKLDDSLSEKYEIVDYRKRKSSSNDERKKKSRDWYLPEPINSDARSDEKFKTANAASSSQGSSTEDTSNKSKVEAETTAQSPTQCSPLEGNSSTPDNSKIGSSISQSPGTPILYQGNPYSRLPDPSNFSQDITEFIPFENLPDATGAYKKISRILSSLNQN